MHAYLLLFLWNFDSRSYGRFGCYGHDELLSTLVAYWPELGSMWLQESSASSECQNFASSGEQSSG